MLRISFRRTSEHDWHERLFSSNWVSLMRQGLYNTTTLPSDGCLLICRIHCEDSNGARKVSNWHFSDLARCPT
jgi:hypothetical protein